MNCKDNTGRSSDDKTGPSCVNISSFEQLRVLGEGGFGSVYLVRKVSGVDNGTLYAMKIMKKSTIRRRKKVVQHTMSERRILERIGQVPFLLKLHYAFQTEKNLYLVTDYLEGGDMFELLNEKECFTEEESRLYIAEIILAIEHVHQMGIVYRDLKPENVLLDRDGHIVIADFGLCKNLLSQKKVKRTYSFCGTSCYMAPEVIAGVGHNMAADWWSVGIILYELLTGTTPFDEGEENEMELYDRILNKRPKMPVTFSSHVSNLISELLEKDPNKRLGGGGTGGASAVKGHPFFCGLNWTDVAQKAMLMPYQPPLNCEVVDTSQDQLSTELPVCLKVSRPQKRCNAFKGFSFVHPALVSNEASASDTCKEHPDTILKLRPARQEEWSDVAAPTPACSTTVATPERGNDESHEQPNEDIWSPDQDLKTRDPPE